MLEVITSSDMWVQVEPSQKNALEATYKENAKALWCPSKFFSFRHSAEYIDLLKSSGESNLVYDLLRANFTVAEVLHCLNKGIQKMEDTETFTLYQMKKMFNQSGSFTIKVNNKVVKMNIWVEPGTVRFYNRDLISVCDGINWYKLEP